MKKTLTFIILLINLSLWAQNDTIIVDQIIARVGDEVILQSSLEKEYIQWLSMGNSASPQAKCNILEEQIIQKLLLNQAKLDSLDVTDQQLEMQLDSRLKIFIQQAGSEEKLEDYLHKSILEIKQDMRKTLKEQMIAQKEMEQITKDIDITPSEVAEYFKNLPPDSLPLIKESYEIKQIVFFPKLTKEEEQVTIDKLNNIRNKIVKGKMYFEAMARLYSEDPESAKKGGSLGLVGRGELDPDFANAAFKLKEGEISPVVKSAYGYHIIKLEKRVGDRLELKHILIRPVIPTEALMRTTKFADSVYNLILNDSLTFEEAAKRFSDDKNTRNNGGYLFNQQTGNLNFTIDQFPAMMKKEIQSLEVGKISKPIDTYDFHGNHVVKLYLLISKTPKHVANLKDDYNLIYKKALASKKNDVFMQWLQEQKQSVYISVNSEYQKCKFQKIK